MRYLPLLLLVAACSEPLEEDTPDAAPADAAARPDVASRPDARPLPDAQLTCRQLCLPDEGYCWQGECKPWPEIWWLECVGEDGLGCCMSECLERCDEVPEQVAHSCGQACSERCKQL